MSPQISEGRSSQNRVGQRMENHIGVRMPFQTEMVRQPHSPEDQRPAGNQPVGVVAGADAPPRAARLTLRLQHIRHSQILRFGYFEVPPLAGDHPHRVTGPFHQ